MVFTGKTKNLGVIGYPIKHSLSPVIQNTAIQEAGIDYAYIAMPIAPEDLEKAVIGLKALNFTGFNVTIPHKVNIMQYLDEIDEMAKLIGADLPDDSHIPIENPHSFIYRHPILCTNFPLQLIIILDLHHFITGTENPSVCFLFFLLRIRRI